MNDKEYLVVELGRNRSRSFSAPIGKQMSKVGRQLDLRYLYPKALGNARLEPYYTCMVRECTVA
jgi:hypothetical protein